MKSIDIFCASPASTAICSSTDQRKMVRHGGTRSLHDHIHRRVGDDYHYHHHRSKSRTKTKAKTPAIPCSSEIPISPRHYFEKYRKSTSSYSSTTTTTPKLNLEFLRRKSSADVTDLYSTSRDNSSWSSSKYLLSDIPLSLDIYSDDDLPLPPPPPPPPFHHHRYNSSSKIDVNPPPRQPLKSINTSKRHSDFKESPVFRSSNYSYDDNPVFEISSSVSSLSRRSVDLHSQKHSSSLSRLNHHHQPHHHHVYGQKSRVNDEFHVQKSSLSRVSNSSHATKPPPPSSSSLTTCKDESHPSDKSSRPRDHQVVELRVSIHCKGCEGKIRKHISRMEGVSSFSIDLATKKVTVIGNVTPLGVLTSISKVKFAEFWPSPTFSSTSNSSSSTSTTTSDMSIVSY
ncbi:OLC1v1004181C1 [Oldenlandia corymbosa var. corymbosa]|uniref:OLC1v1004181C1 n=1 Tax=Oldenlandia corymbosa var. corymbosa TaxID=529605 RepID=A0AAV1DBN8_OLDCO|nr:OLC1v1004181C1 [Oldenlandia corymbosa var. corymbosa]